MVSTRNIIIAVLLVAAGAAAFILLSDSEEAIIKKRFQALGDTFAKEAGESKLLAASKAGKMREFFTETSRIHVSMYDFSRDVARKDLPGYVLQARAGYASLSVDFTDYTVLIVSDTEAEVSLTATVTGKLPTGERTRDIQELSCRLRKEEDLWRIREIEMVEVLER